MKKKLFTTFLFMYTITIHAQNYQMINPDRDAHFFTFNINMGMYGDQVSQCQMGSEGCFLGIRVDSVDDTGNLTYFFPAYGRGDENSTMGICPASSWMGSHAVITLSEELYFNGEGDTIRFQPQAILGNSWTFFNLNDGNFEATVTNIDEELNLSGVTDSVKTITLNRKDENGNIVSDPFNGFTFKIGQKSGLVQTCDLYHFPNDNSLKTLVGKTNPNVGVSLLTDRREIYDMPIGLERHYFNQTEDFSLGTITNRKYVRYLILEKQVIQDSFIYKTERTLYSRTSDWWTGTYDTTFIHDTVTLIYHPTQAYLADLHPFEFVSPLTGGYSTAEYTNGKTTKITHPDMWENYDFPGCMQQILDKTLTFKYRACLGLFSSVHFGLVSTQKENLVYYKKGEEEWGTPIDFDELTSTDELVLEQNLFTIFPNPAKSRFTILKKGGPMLISSIELFSASGQLLKSYTFEVAPIQQIEIKLEDVSGGIYILKIYNQDGRFGFYKVVVR